MTHEVFQALEPFVTVYSDGKVNLNTAPREVMAALGMSEGLVSKVLRFRWGPDGIHGTRDDQSFDSRERGTRAQRVRDPDATGGGPAQQRDHPESLEGRLQRFQDSRARDGARWKDPSGCRGRCPACGGTIPVRGPSLLA